MQLIDKTVHRRVNEYTGTNEERGLYSSLLMQLKAVMPSVIIGSPDSLRTALNVIRESKLFTVNAFLFWAVKGIRPQKFILRQVTIIVR